MKYLILVLFLSSCTYGTVKRVDHRPLHNEYTITIEKLNGKLTQCRCAKPSEIGSTGYFVDCRGEFE